jgi:DNA polymerase-3 subunit alpha
MFLVFDTETTGLPSNYNAPISDSDNWPRMVQIAWQLISEKGKLLSFASYIIKPEGFEIPYAAEKVHGISTKRALDEGKDLLFVLDEFAKVIDKADFIVGHNIEFDINIVSAEFYRKAVNNKIDKKKIICTKTETTNFCQLPGGKGGAYKWPNLSELHQKLFHESFEEAHNALGDVSATSRCFLELIRIGVINEKHGISSDVIAAFLSENNSVIKPFDIEINSNFKNIDNIEIKNTSVPTQKEIDFVHLHVHTQYSILDGAASIKGLIEKAKRNNMTALAITDHGNMFGVKEFHAEAKKAGIKPILGCEVYVARRTRFNKKDKIDANGDHLILLAKNKTGYYNLIKLVSYAYLEGFYYHPRIDFELLNQYHEGLIASTACIGGIIPKKIKEFGIEEAEKTLLLLKDIFKDDLYLELQRHKSNNPEIDREVYQDQVFINKALIELGKKHNIKCIATNDVHFIEPEDAEAQDRLLCISTDAKVNDLKRLRYTQQEWMKTKDEMLQIFADIPEVLNNTLEIAEKVEVYDLDSPPIMPDFAIPEGFADADEYLKHITYEGAATRWPEITDEIKERIEFELETIKRMGFPGYFLIVWDFLKAAREMGVSVGPGRGSAAGSVVAYCLRITEIDPLKYNLLFERFLNPDRISMPDIDIDFDEDGRDKVLEYVVNKYGAKRVAHIITFGTMGAKMAIRDVARVQDLELSEANRLAKLVPEKPGISLHDAYDESPQLKNEREKGNAKIVSVLKNAEILEGSVRNIGTHACGIIIGKDDLEKFIPITIAKNSQLTYVTQYEGKFIEQIGLLKMDFLGLKTLSIIKDAVENIKLSKNIEIDIDNIPLDDKKTYELYSRGDTTGLFQFESDGMKKYLRELKPTVFEDLIAMNALYRPGPMDYIPDFINRKHKRAKIEYDFPIMESVLKETYGITVYQEQVMELSRIMAGFTRGEADSLRKAMGKKNHAMMESLKPKFIEGCKKLHNLDEKKVLKVWEDWEKFASYAFNKSHATCYSYISYQTAYLKAHYPAEFMAAVLSRHMNDIKKLSFFMDECKRMGIKILGPDVNESHSRFTVNKDGCIRIGLTGIKGIGENAVALIIAERTKNGPFNSIFDFVERSNPSIINKKTIESLAFSGAFDCFPEIKRENFVSNNNGGSFIDRLLKYGNDYHQDIINSKNSLFGQLKDIQINKPKIDIADDWPIIKKLEIEKEYVGIYHSAHPLDNFRFELNYFCTHTISQLKDLNSLKDKDIIFGGMITTANEKFTKTNNPYGEIIIEDFTDAHKMNIFGKDYIEFKNYFTKGYNLIIKARVQYKEWGNRNELELKFKSINLLSEVCNKMLQSVTLKININDINETLISEFEKIINQNKGNITLKFYIYDQEENISVDMFSRTLRINMTNEVINFIENTPELSFQLN